ncbi:MAG: SusD/RagB family nutrient-binding outer membrane lipoprotein [Cyclobacteriaceae bacterium]
MQLYIKLKKIAASTIILLVAGACTDNFEELNTNPALLTEDVVQPPTLFTNVLKNSIYATFSPARIHEFSGYYGNQATGNILAVSDYTSPFNNYRTYIINLSEVIRLTADDPSLNDQNAMARIMKVWNYHIMTDAYGDIPYSEAARPVTEVINQPVYDTQHDIYIDMLNELKEAAAQLGSQGDQISFGAADILYQGDVDNWKKFANSLRFRLANRVRFVDQTLAAQHISEVINALLIDENSENASLVTLQPSATENSANVNPVYNRYIGATTDIFVGLPVTDIMAPADDPRLPLFAGPIADGVSFRGRPIQLLQEEKDSYLDANVSAVGPILKAQTVEIIIMNAAEVYFLRAEAALANITSEDEAELFSLGIQRSMEQYGVDPADIATFMAQPLATLSGTGEAQLEQIITQKYAAIFFQAYEAWAEFRRTGYPKIWVGSELGVTNGQIPRRLTYPSDEYLKNKNNITTAVARLGSDALMTRIWWDVRPGLPYAHPLQGTFPPN